jgi:hypothetical protein
MEDNQSTTIIQEFIQQVESIRQGNGSLDTIGLLRNKRYLQRGLPSLYILLEEHGEAE